MSTITGGIKFFNKSKCRYVDGARTIASSGNASANYSIDRNSDSKWVSSGSSDMNTETLEIDFSGSQTFNRIILSHHNFKQFTIKYNVAGTWTDFTGVSGLDGALVGGISETTFADDTAYYEVNSVTTDKILISVSKTQIANQEKFLTTAIVTTEIGTLSGYPIVKAVVDKNERKKPALSGRMMIIKSIETFSAQIQFKNYPGKSPYGNDLDIMFSIFDLDENFVVWLCGGRRGNYFSYQTRPFRLRDVYECQVSDKVNPEYANNIYTTSVNMVVSITEAV